MPSFNAYTNHASVNLDYVNARSYNLLDRETLLELEEISPHDYYFVSEDFDAAALAFFDEADYEDSFNQDFSKMQPS